MSSPLVSIAVPVYNGMPQLRIAIESLLKQDYGNIELLIADNASDIVLTEDMWVRRHVQSLILVDSPRFIKTGRIIVNIQAPERILIY